MSPHLLAICMASLAMLVAATACAQNVIGNPDFDDSNHIGGWASNPATTGGGASWSASEGNTSPGSLQLLNTGACDCQASTTYCAAVTPNTPYTFRFFTKNPGQPHMYWSGWTSVSWYANTGCTGLVDTPFFASIPADLPTGQWTQRDMGSATAPANAYSAQVWFLIDNTGASGISFYYDDVELLNDRVFHSGFQ